MNYLQLCQRLRSECGIAGTGPTTVTGQVGELLRLVNWVAQSYVEIQEARPDWEWMRKSVTWNTVAAQQEYSASTDMALTDFGMWRNESFRCYLTSAGVGTELILQQVGYTQFRDYYLLNTRRTVQARPQAITITPSKNLMLGFIPNDVYTCSGEYYHAPTVLAADTDTPTMPVRYHMLIVYRAMQKYGFYESASEQIQMGQTLYNEMMNKMQADQSPLLMMGPSLI